LISEYRGLGLGTELQEFIRTQLRDAGCSKAKLSVSRANKTALRHYKRSGWTYLFPNPKGKNMDFYQLDL
jgi:GNAT superfamily N-acetyltransferase